ncbi:MAG: hypothetical protein MI748_19320, partial [Opitutales bacterium]|nr:hypothetical protein [Opitutales bacterium]
MSNNCSDEAYSLDFWARMIKGLTANRVCAVWGTGEYSNALSQFLSEIGISIKYYVDNFNSDQFFLNREVLSPDRLVLKKQDEPIFVIIASSASIKIVVQCNDFGWLEFQD